MTLPRDKTLADYERLGRLEGLLDFLDTQERSTRRQPADIRAELMLAYTCHAIDSYRQMQMNEANEDVEPEIPTPDEVDEMARVDEARCKTGKTPHEL